MTTQRDLIYLAITGSILTRAFNHSEFRQIKCLDYVSFQFESWPEEDLVIHITDLADNLLNQLSKQASEKRSNMNRKFKQINS